MANGNNLLIDNSCCDCLVGSIVKVHSAMARNFKQGKSLQENRITDMKKPANKKYILRRLGCDRKNCKYRLESFGEISEEVKKMILPSWKIFFFSRLGL